jgi:hypothetical protein
MPTASHPPAASALTLRDYDGPLRRSLIGEFGGNELRRSDFLKIMNAPTDSARLAIFNLLIGIRRHLNSQRVRGGFLKNSKLLFPGN